MILSIVIFVLGINSLLTPIFGSPIIFAREYIVFPVYYFFKTGEIIKIKKIEYNFKFGIYSITIQNLKGEEAKIEDAGTLLLPNYITFHRQWDGSFDNIVI